MRLPGIAAALGLGLAASACAAPPRDDAATCLALYDQYDSAAWLYPNHRWITSDDGGPMQPAELNRPMQLLRTSGCVTRPSDLDGMETLAARLAPYRIVDSGPALRPTAVHVGIVTGIYDEGRTTRFFRGLGYRSRGVGALGLGRRIYIGPFTSQGAVDQAIAVAREAGFISPYAAKHTKF
jgi:hypothetical protein